MSDATQKLTIGKEKKEEGDKAFKEGNVAGALQAYHMSLMYLTGLDKSAIQSLGLATTTVPSTDGKAAKEKTEIDDIIEKIYGNMSACHIKNKNYKRAVETADKCLSKNENNYKAMLRKGVALGEQGFYDKAVKILEDLKTKNPSDAEMVDMELKRLKAIDDEREKANKKKLKGFLNKAEKKGESLDIGETPTDAAATPSESA